MYHVSAQGVDERMINVHYYYYYYYYGPWIVTFLPPVMRRRPPASGRGHQNAVTHRDSEMTKRPSHVEACRGSELSLTPHLPWWLSPQASDLTTPCDVSLSQ